MSVFLRSNFFNSIYIVQFLSDQDLDKTGKDLHDYLHPICAATGVNLGFADVSTASEFLDVLTEIVEHCGQGGTGPILHFETHGATSGLGPTAEQFLPWSALVPHLTELNRLSKMNLLVTMAACYGLNLVKTLLPGDESPAWAILGPDEQVLPSDIRNCFQAFYGTLTTKLNLNAALAALRAADSSWPDSWKFHTAEMLFANTFGIYLDSYSDQTELERRESKIISGLVEYGVPDTEMLRGSIRAALRDNEAAFERVKRQFLMLDRYPENESRFPLTIDDVHRITALRNSDAAAPAS